ncbi:MAG: hypothetical protein EXS36_01530 [Pedosphaera sp.]|nr:hypothetical protein [Pedosphaera sp.]
MPTTPTHIRYRIIPVNMLMAFILYLDRICLGEIVKSASFKGDVSLSKEQIVRNRPSEHPACNAAEQTLIGSPPNEPLPEARKFIDQVQMPEYDVAKMQMLLDGSYKNNLY